METRPSDTINLSDSFLRLINLVASYKLTVIITLLVCLGGAIAYSQFGAKVFESKMIIQSDILSESYSLKLAENLDTHIRDGDLDFLSKKLGLTSEEADLLKEFKIVSALTPMSQQMAEKEKIIVVISVRVLDNAILPKLQSGIIQYFSNNDYIKKRVEENRKKYEGLIAALDVEIKRLDTLKNKIANGSVSKAGGGIAFMDVSGLYEAGAKLQEERYDFIIDLATVDSIQVIEEFTPFGKPVWPKTSIMLGASIIVACIFLFGFISFKEAKK